MSIEFDGAVNGDESARDAYHADANEMFISRERSDFAKTCIREGN